MGAKFLDLRIGISGSASVGKTTLAKAISEALAVTLLPEEMRDYLERTQAPFARLPEDAATQALWHLWRTRAAKERETPSFVADNSCLDFAAYALYYGCLDEPTDEADLPPLLREPVQHLSLYDGIFLLPWGVIPYIHDGVRSPSRFLQLRYHLIVDALLRRYADPRKVHFVPESCTSVEDRLAWVISILNAKSPAKSVVAPIEIGEPVRSPARKGFVYLVGAGPGDPALLTMRAFELLKCAEVVAHDELISPSILSLARPGAELLSVGRRHGTLAPSYRMHPLVLERAKAGLCVVRLKAGDPLIFGRGGEEAEELAAAGIPFEIVPGISAALGAAAYAGIPLTHRQYASDVTFVTGHDADGGHRSHSNWPSVAAGKGTLVLFMAAHKLPANLKRLIASGRSPETPAAYIASATIPQQRVIVGTLANLAEKAAGVDRSAPALLVVGEAVALHERIGWFHPQPLAGRRILVARARPGHSQVAAELRRLGAQVIEAPSIEVASLNGASALDAALGRLREFHSIVFGCAAGVHAMLHHARAFPIPIVAIGTEASEALANAGIEPAIRIRGACEDALREHSPFLCAGPLLLVTSDDGRPNLRRRLARIGAKVEALAAYRYVHRMPRLSEEPIDLLVLPSSSAAHAVLENETASRLLEVPMVAMGPLTEEAARRCGAQHVVRAEKDGILPLVSCALSTAEAP